MTGVSFTLNAPAFPFYTGLAESATIGVGYDVALGGRSYLIDWKSGQYAMASTPLIRQQQDSSTEAGEQSLSPEDAWRRSQSSWHYGAGQTYFDLADQDGGRISVRSRFRKSQGIDPWTNGQFSLLPDTAAIRTTTSSTVQVVTAGTRLYALDGTALAYTTSVTGTPTWTATTGTALSSPQSIATDGYNVWVVDANDLYYTTTASTSRSAWHTTAHAGAYLVRYAKGWLFTAKGASLYNHAATGAAPSTALGVATAVTSSEWRWTDVAGGPNAIYASGYVGDKSAIFRTTVNDAGSELTPLVVAGELPDGEVARSLCCYLGGMVVGTSKGVRFATLDTNGDLILGNLIATSAAVRCFEPQDRFIWFGLTNYDSNVTGLGRLDLRTFASDLTPAWASDLMAATTGTVTSACTFGTRRVFAVEGAGVYAESDNKVASGTIHTGWISYGIVEDKSAVEVHTRHASGPGTYAIALAADHAPAYTTLGTPTTTAPSESGGHVWNAQMTQGEVYELRFTLNRSSADATQGPVLKRWTLRAYPSPTGTSATIVLPLLLHTSELSRKDRDRSRDVVSDRQYIELLRETGEMVKYQEPGYSRTVRVQDFRWSPVGGSDRNATFSGTLLVELKVI